MALRLGLGMGLAAACAAALWALPIRSTFGQPGAVELKLVQGKLGITAPAAKAVVGRSVTVAVIVTDARGTGAGWTLKVSAARAVRVSRMSASCAAHSTCTLPAVSRLAGGPVVLRASPRSGMGVIRLAVTLAPLAQGPAVAVKFAVTG